MLIKVNSIWDHDRAISIARFIQVWWKYVENRDTVHVRAEGMGSCVSSEIFGWWKLLIGDKYILVVTLNCISTGLCGSIKAVVFVSFYSNFPETFFFPITCPHPPRKIALFRKCVWILSILFESFSQSFIFFWLLRWTNGLQITFKSTCECSALKN